MLVLGSAQTFTAALAQALPCDVYNGRLTFVVDKRLKHSPFSSSPRHRRGTLPSYQRNNQTEEIQPTMPTPVNAEQILREVNIHGALNDQQRQIVSKDALIFLAVLQRSFNARRKSLLERRQIRQAELDKGTQLDFLPETRHIRENDAWRGAPPAPGLVDRRLEITGPTDRKMVVNALNSDVWTYMADFEGKTLLPTISFREM